MPREVKSCDGVIKKLCTWHHTCSTKGRHKPSFYSGHVLSKFLNISGKLDDTKQYRVCVSIHSQIRDSVNNKEEQDTNEEEKEENDTTQIYSRTDHCLKVVDNIISASNGFRKPYRDLSMRERDRRVQGVAELVIAVCVNKSQLRKDGQDYLYQNLNLCTDIVTVLDALQNRIEKELRANFKTDVNRRNNFTPRHGVTDAQEDSGNVGDSTTVLTAGWNRNDYNGDSRTYKTAVTMLCEATLSGFSRIRDSMLKEFMIPKEWLPSFYMLTKNRPKIESSNIVPILSIGNTEFNDAGIEDTVLPVAQLTPTNSNVKYNLTSFVGDEGMSISTAIDLIESTKEKEIPVAKIDGVYEDYLLLMAKQHVDKGRSLKGSVVVLDSYDGAQHKKTDKETTSIISFSSKLLTAASVKEGCGAGTSLSILTWQQMKGDEKVEYVIPAVLDIFKNKKVMREEQLTSTILPESNLCFYELHDGKMLYLLTQHSLFNRRHTPFILCTCKRGDGVINNDHVCTLLSQEEQEQLWDRSIRAWNDKTKRYKQQGKIYEKSKHLDWIDEHNKGVSHYGIHPNLLRRDSLRFDVFHLRCSITRRLMSHLRKFILRSTRDLIEEFSILLSKFWSNYNVLVWNLNESFACFKGGELLDFIRNIPCIVKWLKERFVHTDTLLTLCDGLNLWMDISPFLVITTVDDNYEGELTQWINLLKRFYDVGRRSFLTKRVERPGDDETFYMHVLRFYLPKIARITFDEHDLGLGIFTMQGFERRNKESKNTLNRFSNTKGNVLCANLRRLWDIFYYEQNAI